jgi:prostaglandin-E synthase
MTVVACPLVLWAQRADKVFVSVQLGDITEEQINVESDTLSFKANSQGKTWETKIEFNHCVIPEESTQKNMGREFLFELKKKDPGPFWPRLIKGTAKQQNIKVDFNRWKDEDDESDDEGMPGMGGMGGMGGKYDDASLEDMMQQMGTNSGEFDPDEGCSDDSDDDDLPELEGADGGAKVNGDA